MRFHWTQGVLSPSVLSMERGWETKLTPEASATLEELEYRCGSRAREMGVCLAEEGFASAKCQKAFQEFEKCLSETACPAEGAALHSCSVKAKEQWFAAEGTALWEGVEESERRRARMLADLLMQSCVNRTCRNAMERMATCLRSHHIPVLNVLAEDIEEQLTQKSLTEEEEMKTRRVLSALKESSLKDV